MRTVIQIEDEDIRNLKQFCKQKGWSRARAIRESIRLMLENNACYQDSEVFGIWKNRATDGVKYQEKLRREWDR